MVEGFVIVVTAILIAYIILLIHSFQITDRRYKKLEKEVRKKRQQKEIKEGCIKQSLSENEKR